LPLEGPCDVNTDPHAFNAGCNALNAGNRVYRSPPSSLQGMHVLQLRGL